MTHEAGCICQHGAGGRGLGTSYAAFLRPADRSMRVYAGPPCLGWSIHYTLA